MMATKPGVPKQRKYSETLLELLGLPDDTLMMILHFDSDECGELLCRLCQLKRTSRHFEKLCTLAIRSLKRLGTPITERNQDVVFTHCKKLQVIELFYSSQRRFTPYHPFNWSPRGTTVQLDAPKFVKILETNRNLIDITLSLEYCNDQIRKNILQAITCTTLSLQRLSLSKRRPIDIDLVPLLKVHAKSLKELQLFGAFVIDSTEVILPNLETLRGDDNTFMGFIRIAPNLHTLYLTEDAVIEDFEPEELQLLTNLSAIYSSIPDVDVFYVLPCQKYQNLTELELRFTMESGSVDISPIARRCTSLKKFAIRDVAELEVDGILRFLKFCKSLEEFMCWSPVFVDVIRLAKEERVVFPGLRKLGFFMPNRYNKREVCLDWCSKIGSVTTSLQVLTILEYGDELLEVADIIGLYNGGLDLQELYVEPDYSSTLSEASIDLPWHKNIFPNMKIYGKSLISRKNGQVIVTPHYSVVNAYRFFGTFVGID